MNLRRIAPLALLVALGAAACGTVAIPAPDQKALVFDGGVVVSAAQKFKKCLDPATRERQGSGDKVFYYPAGLRSYKFSSDEGSDAGPLTASTRDSIDLVVKGTVSFTLNPDCSKYTDAAGKEWPGGKLQKFHDTIGRKFGAFTEEENTEPSDGWDRMIGTYIKDVVDRAVDNEAIKYGWAELYGDTSKKAQWERDVISAIPALVKAQAGEDFFTVNNITLQKPDLPEGLKNQLRQTQEAVERGKTSAVDRETAAKWPGGPAAYAAYQRQLAINKAIAEGKVKIIPVPEGVSVNIDAD